MDQKKITKLWMGVKPIRIKKSTGHPLSTAHWIWDRSNRSAGQYYLQARKSFLVPGKVFRSVQDGRTARLYITADAYYQAWINGTMLGHGPAKSPESERFVDSHDLSGLLTEGGNLLEIVVHSLGSGTMNCCPGEAGLIFELQLPEKTIGSDATTQVRQDPRRLRKTVRRWILPSIEDVDAAAPGTTWKPARIVKKQTRLLARPVPPPGRQSITARRMVSFDTVTLPDFSVSFRIKPYLVEPDQVQRCNIYRKAAYLVTDLLSDCDQELTLVPTGGEISWYFNNRKIIEGSGWAWWDAAKQKPVLQLKKGSNRLVGIHFRNHFEEIHLAGFALHPVKTRNPFGVGGFQIISMEGGPIPCGARLPQSFAKRIAAGDFPLMDSEDTLPNANFHDVVANAIPFYTGAAPKEEYLASTWRLPATSPGTAARLIVDLATVHNGWFSFKAFGKKGSRLIFSFFEGLEYGPPLRLNWTETCNNAVSYRLKDGWQSFETFFAYGARYVAIHHEGPNPVDLHELQLLTANCGGPARGAFRSDHLELNAIYALCEQTLFSATDDTLTDCPTYEAVNWNFDNRLAAMGDLVTFRNIAILRNTIEQFTRDPRYPGLVRCHTPSTWDIRIPVFCFHWILFCREFQQATGDLAFARRVWPQVVRGIDEALSMVDSSGLMRWPADEQPWHIIDWHSGRDDDHPRVSAEQALLVGALEAAASLAEVVGGSSALRRGKEARVAASRLRSAIHDHFWVAGRDAYADSIHEDGTLSSISSQPSNAALAFYGIGSVAWRERLLARIRDRDGRLLTFGSPMGLFYILEFLDQCGDVETIFAYILEKWGYMVKVGDGTAWEHFPEFGYPRFPTRSRCHPFGAYILKYFAKYLLGVTTAASGAPVRFQPQPPSWLAGCEGVVPTGRGPVRTRWTRTAKGIEAKIEVPRGVAVKKLPLL